MRHPPRQLQEIDIDSLLVTAGHMPTARRATGERITSALELYEIFRKRGIGILKRELHDVIAGEGFESKNPSNGHENALFMSDVGTERLIDFVNAHIEDTWDNARTN